MPTFNTFVPTNSVFRFCWVISLLNHNLARKVEITETNKSPRNRQSHQPENAKLGTTISPLCSVFYSALSCTTRTQLKK